MLDSKFKNVFRSQKRSLGSIWLGPGIFLFPALLFLLIPVQAEILFTPQSTLKGNEGEILSFIFQKPKPASPAFWSVPAKHTVAHSTGNDLCEYRFRFHEKSIHIATDTVSVGLLDVSVVNRSKTEAEGHVWFAWRHSSPEANHHPTGILLHPPEKNPAHPLENEWTPKATWYFQDDDFLRDGKIIYSISEGNGWARETWIRSSDASYEILSPTSCIGYTHVSQKLVPGASASIRIMLPAKALNRERRNVLEPLMLGNKN